MGPLVAAAGAMWPAAAAMARMHLHHDCTALLACCCWPTSQHILTGSTVQLFFGPSSKHCHLLPSIIHFACLPVMQA